MPVPIKSGPSIKAVQVEPERLWRKRFAKEMSFKSGIKGWGSDRWWERKWVLWWGDMCKIKMNQILHSHLAHVVN